MPSSETKVHFVSLGCPKNLVDSEVMLGHLAKEGYSASTIPEDSDVLVVNTCGFIDASKQESIDTILELAELKKADPTKLLVVTGCLSQRYGGDLEKLLPEVDLFLGTGNLTELPARIAEKRGTAQLADLSTKSYFSLPGFVPSAESPRVAANASSSYSRYVKIAEGCSHSCSFCIIPTMRGGLKSRPMADILHELDLGLAQGVKEFNFISQDLNEYGRDLPERPSLTDLLAATKDWTGDFWIRLLYLYPLHFPNKLVRLMAEHPHVLPYVDIPLQHIDNTLLQSMNRGSSDRYIRRLIENLRTAMPNLIIRTTFIVGYPGETDDQFKRLVDFVGETEFDRVGAFTYSEEDGTAAAHLPNPVPHDIREERQATLMAVQQKISQTKNKRFKGTVLRALYEGVSSESDLLNQARFYGQAPEIDGVILINDRERDTATPGDFVDIRITETHDYDLVGTLL